MGWHGRRGPFAGGKPNKMGCQLGCSWLSDAAPACDCMTHPTLAGLVSAKLGAVQQCCMPQTQLQRAKPASGPRDACLQHLSACAGGRPAGAQAQQHGHRRAAGRRRGSGAADRRQPGALVLGSENKGPLRPTQGVRDARQHSVSKLVLSLTRSRVLAALKEEGGKEGEARQHVRLTPARMRQPARCRTCLSSPNGQGMLGDWSAARRTGQSFEACPERTAAPQPLCRTAALPSLSLAGWHDIAHSACG